MISPCDSLETSYGNPTVSHGLLLYSNLPHGEFQPRSEGPSPTSGDPHVKRPNEVQSRLGVNCPTLSIRSRPFHL